MRALRGDGLPASRADLAREAAAAVLVTAAAVPLGVGLAAVAGVPPATGLWTSVVPLVAFALLGSSRHLKIGLDAGSAALLAATLPGLAAGDPDRYLALAATLTLVTGVILLLAGLLRLGALAELFSQPALVGYTAGVALGVVIGQLPRALGVTAEGDGDLELLADVVRALPDAHAATAALSVGTLLVLVAGRRLAPRFPVAALVLVAAVALGSVVDLAGHGVATVGALPPGLDPPTAPALSAADVLDVLPAAALVALVAGTDSVITSRSFATRLGYRVDASRDLVGLGAANIGSALTGGVVASASYGRTAVAERAGSRSQVSGVLAAVVMLGVLLLLRDPLGRTPLAVLAVIVIDAVARLADPRGLLAVARVSRPEALLAVAVATTVLARGLLPGVAVAAGGAFALLAVDLVRLRDEAAAPPPAGAGSALRLRGPVAFLTAARTRDRLVAAAGGRPGDEVVADLSAVPVVDVTGAAALRQAEHELAHRDVRLRLVGLRPTAARRLAATPPADDPATGERSA